MTEDEWNRCTDALAMLHVLRTNRRASERSVRLFMAACARSLRSVFGDRQEVVAAGYERYADGQASEADLMRWLVGELFDRLYPGGVIPPARSVWELARTAARTATDFTHLDARDNTEEEKVRICHLLRDLFGPLPFRPVSVEDGWLTWNAGAVRRLAEAAYQERELPAGTLDTGRLGVLADALEEAGCTDADLLGHLRGPGPHVRGCWAVDLLSGRNGGAP
jgi:hypothetical protein